MYPCQPKMNSVRFQGVYSARGDERGRDESESDSGGDESQLARERVRVIFEGL